MGAKRWAVAVAVATVAIALGAVGAYIYFCMDEKGFMIFAAR